MFGWFKRKRPFVPDKPTVPHNEEHGTIDTAWLVRVLKGDKQ